MRDKDIKLLEEEYKTMLMKSRNYGPFDKLTTTEKYIVDAFMSRTSIEEFLKIIERLQPELYDKVMEEVVLMAVKDPTGM